MGTRKVTKADKRLVAIRTDPRQVRPEELEAVLLAVGSVYRQSGTSHRVYRRGSREILVIPQQRPFIKEPYVRRALDLLGKGE